MPHTNHYDPENVKKIGEKMLSFVEQHGDHISSLEEAKSVIESKSFQDHINNGNIPTALVKQICSSISMDLKKRQMRTRLRKKLEARKKKQGK